jgi:hypothetical protein
LQDIAICIEQLDGDTFESDFIFVQDAIAVLIDVDHARNRSWQ